ncbi:MM3350-like domain-containing protein [Halenospora varia]|nr:MM3350-like domain-containing protein [Halenospora varia]
MDLNNGATMHSGTPNRDSSEVKLFKVLDDPETEGKTIHYNYDFGDGWEHVIACTGRTTPTSHFVCVEGEGHGCTEDVGGYLGWQGLLEAYDAPNPTNDQNERIN